MGSIQLKELSLHTEFRDRVRVMLTSSCTMIVGEDSATENTEKRQNYAVGILNNPDNFVHRFSQALVVQSGIAQNITIDSGDPTTLDYTGGQTSTAEFDAIDIEIQSHINAIFNDLAGILNL